MTNFLRRRERDWPGEGEMLLVLVSCQSLLAGGVVLGVRPVQAAESAGCQAVSLQSVSALRGDRADISHPTRRESTSPAHWPVSQGRSVGRRQML